MPRAKKAVAEAAPEVEEAATMVVAGGIEMVPLGRLRRAPENVRHTNQAVDVEGLADDIAAHGLLQNLIGYAGDTSIDKAVVYIVGGGRRLQALQRLLDLGALTTDFSVPVLLRSPAEAIDLSLSENLAKRDMNPADEFLAFEALMKPGLLSPADLAKKFGFTERYVKQRLRLAALAPEILDAMREGKLTIDAAMAYAGTQDRKLQLKIFAAESKKPWSHGVQSIRSGIVNAVMTTGDCLFKFVGQADYEKKGGRYEDDLFGEAESYSGRKLIDPDIITSIAADRANFQIEKILASAKADHPSTSNVILVPGLRLGKVPPAPKGYDRVERPYWRNDLPELPALRDKASALGIDIIGYAGIDHGGRLKLDEGFFVPGARLSDVLPPQPQAASKTAAQIAAERRAGEVRSCAAFLAAQKIRDDKVEGRQFWRTTRPDLWRATEVEGLGQCHAVGVDVFVTAAEIDAQLEAAEAEYDRQEAEKVAKQEAEAKAKEEAAAALEVRRAEILSMDPQPVVIQVDGLAHFRWESGAYADEREDSPEADECSFYDDLGELLEGAGSIGLAWDSLDSHDADPHGDNADLIQDQAA